MKNRLIAVGLAAALMGGASAPALADCAGDLQNAWTAYDDTLANATKPGADLGKDVPKNEPPGYTASGGPAPNLPGEGNAGTTDGAAKPAADAQPSEAQPSDAQPSGTQAADAQPAPASGAPASEVQTSDAQTSDAQAPAGEAQTAQTTPPDAAAPAAEGGEQMAAGAPAEGGADQTQQQIAEADQSNELRDGNPPSSGDMKGDPTAEAEADLKKEKPSLGLALVDLNHAAAYAEAGNEESCLQSLAKVEDTLNAWRSGS